MHLSPLPHATQLRPHSVAPGTAALPEVQVRWQLSVEGWFTATFRVMRPAAAATWNYDPDFSRTDYRNNWGLWEHDVVELFLQPRPYPEATAGPYLEVQVSPLGQPFALWIEEPARRFAPPAELALVKEVSLTADAWQTRLSVRVPGYAPGAPLFGNLTACLGPAHARGYWALALNPGPTPDFHRPTDFVQLI